MFIADDTLILYCTTFVVNLFLALSPTAESNDRFWQGHQSRTSEIYSYGRYGQMPKHFFGDASRPKQNIRFSAEAICWVLQTFFGVHGCLLFLGYRSTPKGWPSVECTFLIAGSRGLSSKLQKENWVKGSDNGCCAWQSNRISISSALSGRNKMSGAENIALKRLKEYT